MQRGTGKDRNQPTEDEEDEMTRDARDQMLKMKLKLSSVTSVGPELSALKAIYFLKASLKPFQSCFRCITCTAED